MPVEHPERLPAVGGSGNDTDVVESHLALPARAKNAQNAMVPPCSACNQEKGVLLSTRDAVRMLTAVLRMRARPGKHPRGQQDECVRALFTLWNRHMATRETCPQRHAAAWLNLEILLLSGERE